MPWMIFLRRIQIPKGKGFKNFIEKKKLLTRISSEASSKIRLLVEYLRKWLPTSVLEDTDEENIRKIKSSENFFLVQFRVLRLSVKQSSFHKRLLRCTRKSKRECECVCERERERKVFFTSISFKHSYHAQT